MARLKLCDGLFAEVVPVPLCAPAGTLRRGHVTVRRQGRIRHADLLAYLVTDTTGEELVVAGVGDGAVQVCVQEAEEAARSVHLDVRAVQLSQVSELKDGCGAVPGADPQQVGGAGDQPLVR